MEQNKILRQNSTINKILHHNTILHDWTEHNKKIRWYGMKYYDKMQHEIRYHDTILYCRRGQHQQEGSIR